MLLFHTACVRRRPQVQVKDHDDLVLYDVATEVKCARLCIQETSLVCRLAEYYTSSVLNGTCALSRGGYITEYKSNIVLYELCEYL